MCEYQDFRVKLDLQFLFSSIYVGPLMWNGIPGSAQQRHDGMQASTWSFGSN